MSWQNSFTPGKTYEGIVRRISGDIAYVSIYDDLGHEQHHTLDITVLRADCTHHLVDDDAFTTVFQGVEGFTSSTFLPPRSLTPEEVQQIFDEVDALVFCPDPPPHAPNPAELEEFFCLSSAPTDAVNKSQETYPEEILELLK